MKLTIMPLDPSMYRPISSEEDSFLKNSKQAMQLTPYSVGMNNILARVLRNMESVINEELEKDCALVNLPTPAGIAYQRKSLFDAPSIEEIALRFLTDVGENNARNASIFQFNTELVDPFHDGFIVSNESKVLTAYTISGDFDKDDMFNKMRLHFLNIFRKLGLPILIVKDPTGSYDEYMALNEDGDTALMYNPDIQVAINREMLMYQDMDAAIKTCGIRSSVGTYEERRAIKIGEAIPMEKLPIRKELDKKRSKTEVTQYHLTRYRINFNNVLNCIIKNCYGEHGLIWPDAIAPFEYHIVSSAGFKNEAQHVYDTLRKNGIQVLLDDRLWVKYENQRMFANFLGIPKLIALDDTYFNNPNIKSRDTVKVINRRSGEDIWIPLSTIIRTHNK